jgi:hypothetical protein
VLTRARTELLEAFAEDAFDLERARRTLLAWNERIGAVPRSLVAQLEVMHGVEEAAGAARGVEVARRSRVAVR